MPEAVAPVVPASTTSTATPTTPVAPAAPPVDDRAKKLEADLQKKQREYIVERRKWEADRKASAEKLSRLSELEKREASAKLNPTEFLRGIYGDNWYDTLVEAKLNGVPPAALIQQEVQKMRDDFEAKLKSRDEEVAKSRETSQAKQVENARRTIFAESAEFYRTDGKEYPVLSRLGGEPAIARAISQRIESEFHKTTQLDESTGEVLRQGRVLSPKEAAEMLEDELLGIASEAMKHEKYKTKLQPASSSATVASSSQQQGQNQTSAQQRKTLSNDITASTQSVKPPVSKAERRERAQAAYDAERRRKAE